MAIFFVKKQTDVLKKKPYSTFLEEFHKIKDNLNNASITVPIEPPSVGGCKDGFYFELDHEFAHKHKLKFIFFPPEVLENEAENVLCRMEYSCEFEEVAICAEYFCDVAQSIQERIDLLFIPSVEYVECEKPCIRFREIELAFNVITTRENIATACCSLINQVIAYFAMER